MSDNVGGLINQAESSNLTAEEELAQIKEESARKRRILDSTKPAWDVVKWHFRCSIFLAMLVVVFSFFVLLDLRANILTYGEVIFTLLVFGAAKHCNEEIGRKLTSFEYEDEDARISASHFQDGHFNGIWSKEQMLDSLEESDKKFINLNPQTCAMSSAMALASIIAILDEIRFVRTTESSLTMSSYVHLGIYFVFFGFLCIAGITSAFKTRAELKEMIGRLRVFNHVK